MSAETLSPGERATLTAMVRFPSYNDRELARATRAKRSTVAATRARLLEKGWFLQRNLPSLPGLGALVLSVSHGEGPAPADRWPAGECDSFFVLAGPSGWLEVGAFSDFSGAQRRGEAMAALGAAGLPGVRARFPMEMVRFHNFFDFTPVLARLFPVRGGSAGPRQLTTPPARRLSAVERLVLYGLVKWPGDPDRAVAGALGVSRQAVSRVRRLLAGDGRLVPAVIPDCGRLGIELLALLHCRFDARRPPEEQDRGRQRLLEAVPSVFAVSAGPELVALGAHAGLAGLEKGPLAVLRRLGDEGLLDGPPVVRTFLLEDTAFVRNLDFAPFVKSILGLSIAD